jgi:hypothetical protein
VTVAALRSTEPIASARWRRRSGKIVVASFSESGSRSLRGRRIVGTEPPVVLRTSLLIVRFSRCRASIATITITRICAGLSRNQ